MSRNMLLIRDADEKVVSAIESMVADFVKGLPAERHPRSALTLRAAYFGDRPVAHLLVGDRSGEIVGMVQWTLLYDMFWGMFGPRWHGSTSDPNAAAAGSSRSSSRGFARRPQPREQSFCMAAAVTDRHSCTNEWPSGR